MGTDWSKYVHMDYYGQSFPYGMLYSYAIAHTLSTVSSPHYLLEWSGWMKGRMHVYRGSVGVLLYS